MPPYLGWNALFVGTRYLGLGLDDLAGELVSHRQTITAEQLTWDRPFDPEQVRNRVSGKVASVVGRLIVATGKATRRPGEVFGADAGRTNVRDIFRG